MNPLHVQVSRGEAIESEHLVDAVIVDVKGKIIEAFGKVDSIVYPRSAIKMIQALAFVESGAVEKFNLTEKEISLACASHDAQDIHITTVRAWLDRLDLGSDNLECGAHKPYDEKAAEALIRQGKKPERVHNNCSGKHSGIISTCVCLEENPKGYSHYDHPAQIRLRKLLSELSGLDYSHSPWGIDGCGIPTYAIPLLSIAQSMACLLPGAPVTNVRTIASERILKAIRQYPEMISGEGGLCTEVVRASRGRSIIKTGAEGVYTALIPEKGIALALKCRDGGSRASQVSVLHLLQNLGGVTEAERTVLVQFSGEIIRNWERVPVGQVQVVSTGHKKS